MKALKARQIKEVELLIMAFGPLFCKNREVLLECIRRFNLIKGAICREKSVESGRFQEDVPDEHILGPKAKKLATSFRTWLDAEVKETHKRKRSA